MRARIFATLITSIVLTLTGGCVGATSTPTAVPTHPPATSTPTAMPANLAGPITLQYIGHSCTLITAPDGTRIISDPYGSNRPSGLASLPDNLTAEAVTFSHSHPDHNNVMAIKGDPQIMNGTGSFQVGMVKITGYVGDHGLVNGASTGKNTVFVFEIGAVKIVHLGAAGVVTQADILAAMEKADVVFMDVMGDAAHPLKDEMDQLLERNARTIIPAHYSFDENSRYYGSVTLDEFLRIVPSDLTVVRQKGSVLQVTANMPKQLVILAPAANQNQ
jgi:L-ascorbate metabolism protein UlaG (beta-lactamase superfamily)